VTQLAVAAVNRPKLFYGVNLNLSKPYDHKPTATIYYSVKQQENSTAEKHGPKVRQINGIKPAKLDFPLSI